MNAEISELAAGSGAVVWPPKVWEARGIGAPRRARFAMMHRLMLFVLLTALLASGCGRKLPYVWVNDLPKVQEPARIQPGDRISVLVRNQEQLSGEFEVRPNGNYQQPLVGEVGVLGLTPEEAATQLAGLLRGIVVEPQVQVSISQPRTLRISVLGEVRAPGVHESPLTSTVLDLLARAGGMTEFADRSGIYVIRRNPRLARIRFRYEDLTGGDQRSLEFKLRDGDALVVE